MENTFDGILDMYLFESTALLSQLEELLINAEKSKDFSENDINEIFRIMHTIKGSSAMMDFEVIMNVAHKMEDVFFFIRETGISQVEKHLIADLFNLMFYSSDFLTTEISKLQKGEELSTQGESLYIAIDNFLKKLSGTAPSNVEPNANNDSQNNQNFPFSINILFDEGIGMENIRAFMFLNALTVDDIEFVSEPANVESNPSTAEVISEKGLLVSFKDSSDVEHAIRLLTEQPNIRSYELLDFTPESAESQQSRSDNNNISQSLESSTDNSSTIEHNSVEKNTTINKGSNGSGSVNTKQSLISVNLSKLDSLMALVGEIVITESMVTSSPDLTGLQLNNFSKSARQLRKLTDELQDIAMSLRMVPVSGVFSKMNRIVRDMNQKLEKDVVLEIDGEETELDKTIIDSIGDPIMHIVRNSMDHGIETDVNQRIANGKPVQAKIKLSAKHTGSDIIIKIEDDGKGIDPEIILAKAKKNNLLTKPETEYTQREIFSLLMLPGFSTNDTVTEFSGRGVGMDVVKKKIEDVGGSITISSQLGKGTSTILRIPLTLAIVSGMKIRVSEQIYTIPIVDLKQSFNAKNADIIRDVDNNEYIKRQGVILPIIRLHQLHEIEDACTNIEDGILLWIEFDELQYCLLVDEILGEHQVVVKPLPVFLSNFNAKLSGVSGCTILGNGNISIILDVINLYELSKNL